MSDLDQQIGKRLRKARKLRGYKSARSFAIEQQIPESTYSQHETGKRSLNPETFLRYCGYLRIEPGWLLTGKESSPDLLLVNEMVPEAKLNASARQTSNQQADSTTKITDDFVFINMDVFRSVLNKAIHKFLEVDTQKLNVDELIKYCFGVYNGIVTRSREVEQSAKATTRD